LGAILAERARKGVAVWFLYDAFGSSLPDAYIARLRAAGVRSAPFRPLRFRNLWVVQNRFHVRGIVVDGRVGWTGGFGIDDTWLGGGRKPSEWRETNVRFEGPAALQLEAAFVDVRRRSSELAARRCPVTRRADACSDSPLVLRDRRSSAGDRRVRDSHGESRQRQHARRQRRT
jgi:phosphatidylserine/phosphatidylglycerophosphate/cardiolipin synthase-like enzyme